MKNKLILLLLLLLIFIYGCATPTKKVPTEEIQADVPSETEAEISEEKTEEEIEKIPAEIKELLSLADKKVQSISYKYKEPQTKVFYEFFVRGNKMKYILDPTYKSVDIDEDAYDTIYLNKETETALAYCDGRKCRVKGKKDVLDYDEAYIWTPFDWLSNIESAEKTGEELIEKRSTWKLETNTGMLWIDTFFGVPLEAEFGNNKYYFAQMSFNDVKDEDVNPS